MSGKPDAWVKALASGYDLNEVEPPDNFRRPGLYQPENGLAPGLYQPENDVNRVPFFAK